ncbi:Protein CBG17802 [Caenorhabditis briggsae]|uniref:Protein CBG17802 n=1 Tax=Caenorhabditis briggsae TaxID=6238 RepID=A8XRU1_CAEBR|nr:Protein CBG17802 [Caenorhabditis briggsae]CAP35366.2 Protein CBG17802 [Caenorhabditis briggsae]
MSKSPNPYGTPELTGLPQNRSSTKIAALLALFALIQPIHGIVTMKVVLGGPNDSCAKYTKKGHEFLKITHGRIMQQTGGVIVGNMLCTPKTFDEAKLTYTMVCDGVSIPGMGYLFMLAVTARKQMLSGPIDYHYNEKMMGLVENKFLDAENLKNQQFDHEQHLFIKAVEIEGIRKSEYFLYEDCGSVKMRGLIADHGLYFMLGPDDKKNEPKNHLSRMYYEPYGINEHMVMN